MTIAYDVDSCFPICFLLAPANRSDSKMLCRTVNEVERFLAPNPQRIYRIEAGYWKGANFNKLDKLGYQFITQIKWYPKITKTLEALFEDNPLGATEEREIVVNSERIEIQDFEKKLRVIALANRRARRLARQEANKEDPDSKKDEVPEKKKRPFCLLTNVWDIPTKKVVSYYERRWEIEQFIRQAKQAWHLGTFCNTEHNAIKSHIWLLFYSYSLIQLFRREVMSQAGVENKAVGWLRQELFIRSGRLYPRLDGGLTITFSHSRQIDSTVLAHLRSILQYLQAVFLASTLLLGRIFKALLPNSSNVQLFHYLNIRYIEYLA